MKTLNYFFGMEERIRRKEYLIWGVIWMLLKYAGEFALYYAATGNFLTPDRFLSPVLSYRYPHLFGMSDWVVPLLVLWSLPFVWIGTGMSIRRSADAGYSPWLGLLFFIPGLNYLLILGLCLAPTKENSRWAPKELKVESTRIMSPLLMAIGFALLGTGLTWFSTNLLNQYSTSLFVGSPLFLGVVQGYLLHRRSGQDTRQTISFVLLTILLIHLLLLIFALEGVICLAMSLPLAAMLGLIGASFGISIARYGRPSTLSPMLMVLALPLMPLIENQVTTTHQDMVLSRIEINAPPEAVWPNVVKFSDLPPTTEWLFELGVAHPLRARIEGTGVGAVRHCEFSTGSFVEPITVWDEPHRLAFDVRYQPQPMKELSFYDHVDAPHLHGYFRSQKGEFRLVPLEGGRTLLEGRTWYEMDIQPGWYWQTYGRWFIHQIHWRVLAHIKNLAERP